MTLKIGNSDGVMRSTTSSVPAGSSALTSSVFACMSWSEYGMSASGAKMTETSQAPRIVLERTRRAPSTVRAASSRGRVTASCIIRGERSPACATIWMRGNSTSG